MTALVQMLLNIVDAAGHEKSSGICDAKDTLDQHGAHRRHRNEAHFGDVVVGDNRVLLEGTVKYLRIFVVPALEDATRVARVESCTAQDRK